jgi:uncharacterized protein YqgC (DUF456 family)
LEHITCDCPVLGTWQSGLIVAAIRMLPMFEELWAVLGEYIARPDLYKAGRAGFGAWIGLLFGAAAKLALAFLMVGVFVTALII